MTTLLLIGLGNPGKSYAGNRHNIGFMTVDAIADAYGFSKWSKKFTALICEGSIGGVKTLLLKPQTYMNLSGGPGSEAVRFYKIPPERVVVIHDELDLPLGKLRVKKGGGNGGHNGLKSLDEHLGKEYWRVRVGIGHPGDKDMVADYVLSDFTRSERKQADIIVDEIARNIDLLLDGDEAKFMSRIALKTKYIL